MVGGADKTHFAKSYPDSTSGRQTLWADFFTENLLTAKVVRVGLELKHYIALGLFVPDSYQNTRRIARYDTSAVCICGQPTDTSIGR